MQHDVFLEPNALEIWMRIMKPGGILCIVHKTAVWPKWQDQQDKLVANKVWEKVWVNEDPVRMFIKRLVGRTFPAIMFAFM